MMIKSTFFNLPEEKRNRVTQAIVNEFASSETEKVSINRIIKAAEISRGSFYQYFDDKVDLVEVLLTHVVEVIGAEVDRAIHESDGDIFYTYERLFDAVVTYTENPTQRKVLKNLARNIRANDNIVSDYLMNRFRGRELDDCLVQHFSRKGLRLQSDEEMLQLNHILTLVLKNSVFNYLVRGDGYEAVRASLLQKMDIIRGGAADSSRNAFV